MTFRNMSGGVLEWGQYRLYTAGANDAVMRTFVILAQTFTGAKPGPRRQHKKLSRVSALES